MLPAIRRTFSTVPSTMSACVVRDLGDTSRLNIEQDRIVPKLTAGQVLVRNRFAGLNMHDTYTRSGLYPMPSPTNFVVGCEGGGHVAHIPAELRDSCGLREGDAVVYLQDGPHGTYSEYTPVVAGRLMPVPDNLELDVATATAVQGLTAQYLVNDSHAVRPDEWCLVHAGAGGTGQWIIKLAKLAGARIIATVGSEAKAAIAHRCGADNTIVVDGDEAWRAVAEKVRRLTTAPDGGAVPPKTLYGLRADGVHAVFDGVGLAAWEASLDSLRPQGMAVFFGNASGAPPPVPPLLLSAKGSLSLTRPKLHDFLRTRDEVLQRSSAVFGLLASGEPVAIYAQRK